MTTPILCPACVHHETMQARLNGYERHLNVESLMFWQRPFGGAKGQQLTPHDYGRWKCLACGLSLSPRHASVLLDAALWALDPECDSIGEDGRYADAVRAAMGGDR